MWGMSAFGCNRISTDGYRDPTDGDGINAELSGFFLRMPKGCHGRPQEWPGDKGSKMQAFSGN